MNSIFDMFANSLVLNVAFSIVAVIFGFLAFYRQYLQLRKEQREVSEGDSRSIRNQIDKLVSVRMREMEDKILRENSQADIDQRVKQVVQDVTLDEIFREEKMKYGNVSTRNNLAHASIKFEQTWSRIETQIGSNMRGT